MSTTPNLWLCISASAQPCAGLCPQPPCGRRPSNQFYTHPCVGFFLLRGQRFPSPKFKVGMFGLSSRFSQQILRRAGNACVFMHRCNGFCTTAQLWGPFPHLRQGVMSPSARCSACVGALCHAQPRDLGAWLQSHRCLSLFLHVCSIDNATMQLHVCLPRHPCVHACISVCPDGCVPRCFYIRAPLRLFVFISFCGGLSLRA